MTESHSILKQTGTQFVGRAVGVLLGVLVLGTTTRLLGPTLFGVYGTALAYMQLFGILMDFGLTVTTLDLLARSSALAQRRLIGSLVTLRSLLSTLTTVLAFVILQAFPYPPATRHAVYLASLLFICYSFQQLFTSIFQYGKNTVPIVAAELAGRLTTLAGLWMVVQASGGVLGVIASGIAGNIIVIGIMAVWSRSIITWVPSLDHSQWKDVLARSWPIGLTIAFNLVYFKADTIILSFLAPPEVVGLYAAPYKVLEVLISFPPLFLGMVLAQWSAAAHRNDEKVFRQWLGWALSLTAMVVVPLVLGTLALSTDVMTFVAGREFASSGPILQVLVLATSIIFVSNVFGYAIVALGLQRNMIIFYCCAAIVSLVAYTLAIIQWGAIGAAWMTVVTELFILFASIKVISRKMQIPHTVQYLTKYIISGVIMLAVLLLVRDIIHILFSVVLGIVVYGVTLYLIGGMKILYLKGNINTIRGSSAT